MTGEPPRAWPEGSAADPSAARERYANDLRVSRRSLRTALRADALDAHAGLTAFTVVAVLAWWGAGPRAGLIVAGACTGWYALAAAVVLARGRRGREVLRRAYRGAFGWGRWL